MEYEHEYEYEPDPIIWRYFDLAKFIHLIAFKELHFTRIDQLHDKFEGSYPISNIKDWEEKFDNGDDYRNWRNFSCVSCWYISDNESTAMWEIYGKKGQGVAIQSTMESLSQSFLEDHSIVCQEIEYINFLNGKAKIEIPHDVFKYKRIEYVSENEYRASIWGLPQSSKIVDGFPQLGSVDEQPGFPEQGLDVPVKLEVLVKKIVLSPYAQNWHAKTIKEILDRFGYKHLELSKSDLSEDPVYPNHTTK